MSVERIRAIDFTVPLQKEELTLVEAKTDRRDGINFWSYINIFAVDSWIACCIMLTCVSLGFWAVAKSGLEELHGPTDSESFTLLNGIALTIMGFMLLTYPLR